MCDACSPQKRAILDRTLGCIASAVWGKIMPKKSHRKDNDMPQEPQETNYYLNYGVDRAILAHTHASMLLERVEPTGDVYEDREILLDALGMSAVAWSLPQETDPLKFGTKDADALYTWLKAYVLGTAH